MLVELFSYQPEVIQADCAQNSFITAGEEPVHLLTEGVIEEVKA